MAATVNSLELLKAQPKFVDEPGTIYNGMRPEELRRTAEDRLNDMMKRLIRDLPGGLGKWAIRSRFASALSSFPGHDTEDRERMGRYIEQIADILEIEKPRALLTRWLFGPIVGNLMLLTTHAKKSDKEVT